jgi:hypothetical protein
MSGPWLNAVLWLSCGQVLARLSPGVHFNSEGSEIWESIMDVDIVLLVVLAALAALTEVDKLWRRRNNERLNETRHTPYGSCH